MSRLFSMAYEKKTMGKPFHWDEADTPQAPGLRSRSDPFEFRGFG